MKYDRKVELHILESMAKCSSPYCPILLRVPGSQFTPEDSWLGSPALTWDALEWYTELLEEKGLIVSQVPCPTLILPAGFGRYGKQPHYLTNPGVESLERGKPLGWLGAVLAKASGQIFQMAMSEAVKIAITHFSQWFVG